MRNGNAQQEKLIQAVSGGVTLQRVELEKAAQDEIEDYRKQRDEQRRQSMQKLLNGKPLPKQEEAPSGPSTPGPAPREEVPIVDPSSIPRNIVFSKKNLKSSPTGAKATPSGAPGEEPTAEPSLSAIPRFGSDDKQYIDEVSFEKAKPGEKVMPGEKSRTGPSGSRGKSPRK